MTQHDYAMGTRARRWLGFMLRPILSEAVRALLWLCPDTPIVANVEIRGDGAAVLIGPTAIGGKIINVRVFQSQSGTKV